MKREKIILSDFDIHLLNFIKNEKMIFELVDKFDSDYQMIEKHLKRLTALSCIETTIFGTFRKIKINKKGLKIIEDLNET